MARSLSSALHIFDLLCDRMTEAAVAERWRISSAWSDRQRPALRRPGALGRARKGGASAGAPGQGRRGGAGARREDGSLVTRIENSVANSLMIRNERRLLMQRGQAESAFNQRKNVCQAEHS